MISTDQIEEWIAEVEQRPSSAAIIIQYISRRLRDLVERNEELLAENIELRSGRRVEEYESRIANLEYQLNLLRRQLGGQVIAEIGAPSTAEMSLIAYTINGRVVRTTINLETLTSGQVIGRFRDLLSSETLPRLLVTGPQEELLFVFDSGRTLTYPVSAVPSGDSVSIDWGQEAFVEPRGEEELAAVLPVARMTLFDYCMQFSRKGCIKKMMMSSFENHLAKGYIGSGVKQKPDRAFSLALAGQEDRLVVASREGYLLSVPASQISYAAEEVLRLGITDYLVSAFVPGEKATILAVTQSGKAINREMGWLESSESFKSRGQPMFSQTRREAGVRMAGAAAVDEEDWSVTLCSDGRLALHQVGDLLAAGSIAIIQAPVEVVDFTVFSAAKQLKTV